MIFVFFTLSTETKSYPSVIHSNIQIFMSTCSVPAAVWALGRQQWMRPAILVVQTGNK